MTDEIMDLDDLNEFLLQLKGMTNKIRSQNSTRKTTKDHYPIGTGYANAVRRPVLHILNWMSHVEAILDYLAEELHKK